MRKGASFLSLDVIAIEKYRKFAAKFFADDGRAFDENVFDALYRRFDGVTWYVQAVLNEIWSLGEGLVKAEEIDEAVRNLVLRRELTFHDLDASQSDSARVLLRAVAHAGCVAAPTSAAFLSACGPRAPSTIAGALKQLVENELLYKTKDGYIVYDRLFSEYLKTHD